MHTCFAPTGQDGRFFFFFVCLPHAAERSRSHRPPPPPISCSCTAPSCLFSLSSSSLLPFSPPSASAVVATAVALCQSGRRIQQREASLSCTSRASYRHRVGSRVNLQFESQRWWRWQGKRRIAEKVTFECKACSLLFLPAYACQPTPAWRRRRNRPFLYPVVSAHCPGKRW